MDIISDKVVITRKNHNCSACGRLFEKGTKMHTQVNSFDGGIGTWRSCPTCAELLSRHGSHFEDDNIYYANCVSDVLDRGQTPEELLVVLDGIRKPG